MKAKRRTIAEWGSWLLIVALLLLAFRLLRFAAVMAKGAILLIAILAVLIYLGLRAKSR